MMHPARDLILSELVRCRPWIDEALQWSGGTHDFLDIVEAVLDDRMRLWSRPDACIVGQIVVHPKKTVLHLFLAGGNLRTLRKMQPDVQAWARGQGATLISISGRPGWTKALADLPGLLPPQTYMMMEI
jgi:hypothetical protein